MGCFINTEQPLHQISQAPEASNGPITRIFKPKPTIVHRREELSIGDGAREQIAKVLDFS